MTPDELLIQRTFDLAMLGVGDVSPNPRVGCVIVKDGEIIGEGWHKKFGEAHAEVNAVASVPDKSLLRGSTAYVNLEPCSHFGKTPPCSDMLIQYGLKKVVISNVDTNPIVAGTGIKKMKEAGIEVVTGVLEKEGRELNKRFFCYHEKMRPFIILKWAQTSDAFMAHSNFDSRWISNEISRQLVHKWRSEEDAVLVGTKTAAHDNPNLTVRDWSGRNPIRLVIDRFLRLSDNLNLFNKAVPTVCFNVLKHEERPNLKLVRLEGGSQTLSFFIDSGLWDEARIFISPRSFYKGIKAPSFQGDLLFREQVSTDLLQIYHPHTLN
jgi:diaminohydroxyphosphoribosylaminopyrimidine deaminase/5-amino-6-(5-phosphoribosylamino)uracil reductase